MSESLLLIIILIALFVATNAFWAFLTHKLLNKVMSRTFWEYQQGKQIPKAAEADLAEALANVKVPTRNGPNELDSLDELISKHMPI